MAIDFFVFEEGYIRPNYITLERDGVNGFSTMMNQPALLGVRAQESTTEQSSGHFGFLLSAVFAMMYYMASSFYTSRFPDYSHHRPFSCLSEGAIWLRSGYRKLRNLNGGKRTIRILESRFQNQYFLCPLQVHCDMQVVEHSEFESIDQFICEVISSFAKHAPCDHALVFKHHPLDRGYTNYSPLISEMARALHIDQRVYYVDNVSLPDLLRNAEGAVMINSTVGMSSLFHGTPVKVLGEAIYDRRGLTFQGPLDKFWNEPGQVDEDYVARFRTFLTRSNQLNGNLYKRCANGSASGVSWSDKLLAEHSPKIAAELNTVTTRKLKRLQKSVRIAANKNTRDRPTDGFSESA